MPRRRGARWSSKRRGKSEKPRIWVFIARGDALGFIVTNSSRGAVEFDLIARIKARSTQAGVTQRSDVVLGIGDDAALLQMPAGQLLVVATDTLNDGVHFPADTAAADLGWKALAVNLSDFAAMGAQPAWWQAPPP